MQLHDLKPTSKKKNKIRRGRGGKRGTYSGRGIKGQKSRSGRRIRPAERDLIIRLPKQRGFSNKPKSEKPLSFNLKKILPKLKPFLEGKKSVVIDIEVLKQLEIIPTEYSGEVKILGVGELETPINFKGIKVSKGAKIKIEKAGGKVE
ncbi:MAG: uL15 family ribosomal protein [bacterium]|nr:uL15 family ribosomal protein [bacterium]